MNNDSVIISITPETDAFQDVDDGPEPHAPSEWRDGVIGAQQHGWRLDQALGVLAPELSRNYLQQLIEAGAVTLNGVRAQKQSTKVKAGSPLRLEMRQTAQSTAFKAEPMDLHVVHRDDHILVIDKPAGLVVHPAPGHWSGTLMNGLLAIDPRAAVLPRAGIVHRLDKDTSGLMVVARTRAAMDTLVQRIAAREVKRNYIAIAHRPWNGARERDVEAAIGRDPRHRLRMAVVDLASQSGKAAKTSFEMLDSGAAGCVVRCRLHTGRTHQIRVHMASLGHPLLADALYGGQTQQGLSRQALHAQQLAFFHPASDQWMSFESCIPQDMADAARAWGLSYNSRA